MSKEDLDKLKDAMYMLWSKKGKEEEAQSNKDAWDFFKDPEAYIKKTVDKSYEQVSREYRESRMQHEYNRRLLELDERRNEIIATIMRNTSLYSTRTVYLVKSIFAMYPSLENNYKAYDLIIPHLFAVASQMEKVMDDLLPKEWK